MGASHTEAARKYMREHPGVTFPAAKRAVARGTTIGSPTRVPELVPWVRRLSERRNFAGCYFCGEHTLIPSSGDLPLDRRRVQVYCDNDQCDARETEVIVMRDGTETTAARTDVRILERYAPVVDRPASTFIEEIGDWIPGATPAARTETTICLFCGETASVPSSADVPADTGRIRLRCTNARCDVSEVEVLVLRDNTPWTRDRDDVSALEAIIPRREGTRLGGGIEIHRPGDFRFTPEEVLARRVSEPLP
jgi:hypothetical protein